MKRHRKLDPVWWKVLISMWECVKTVFISVRVLQWGGLQWRVLMWGCLMRNLDCIHTREKGLAFQLKSKPSTVFAKAVDFVASTSQVSFQVWLPNARRTL